MIKLNFIEQLMRMLAIYNEACNYRNLSCIDQVQYSEATQDVNMRETIYSLLSTEGSLKSQMVSTKIII